MAVPQSNAVPLRGDSRIDGLTQGSAWQFGSGSRVVTYSFTINDTLDQFGQPVGGSWAQYPGLMAAVERAFGVWSTYVDVEFRNVGVEGRYDQASADIAIILTGDELQQGGALAIGIFPDPVYVAALRSAAGETVETYPHPEGDIAIDNYATVFQNTATGSLGFAYLLHEIGHALGLKHPNDDGANNRPTFAALGVSALAGPDYTLMGEVSGVAAAPETPMLLDVLAIQSIYGPRVDHRSGNDVYALDTQPHRFTIWDTGGNDTIALTTLGVGGTFTLDAGTIQRYGLTTVSIVDGSIIENLLGSTVQDSLSGNEWANLIQGGGGNDEMDGRGGDDAAYGGDDDDLIRGGAGNDRLHGDAGVDRLYGDAGDDRLEGGAGDDDLDGGAGADVLLGGAGNDRYFAVAADDIVIESAGEGVDRIMAGFDITLPAHVEELLLVGGEPWSGTGNELDNRLEGNAGSNLLSGGLGNDRLVSGTGPDVDTLAGGPGDDVYELRGVNVHYTVVELPGEGIDTMLVSSIAATMPDNVENAIISGSVSTTITGNALANRIVGTQGTAFTAHGGGGNDYIEFVPLDPQVFGPTALYGDEGDDYLAAGFGARSVLAGGVGNDIYDLKLSTRSKDFEFTVTGATGNPRLDGATNRYDAANATVSVSAMDFFSGDGAGADRLDVTVTDSSFRSWQLILSLTPTGQLLGVGTIAPTVTLFVPERTVPIFSVSASTWGYRPTPAEGYAGSVTINRFDAAPGVFNLWNVKSLEMEFTFENGEGAGPLTGSLQILDRPAVILDADIRETPGEGNDTLVIDANLPALRPLDFSEKSIENFIVRGIHPLDILGNAEGNSFIGNAARNVFSGRGGDDSYYIDSAQDEVRELPGEGNDHVLSTISYALPANVEALSLLGVANIDGTGNELANILIANAGANTLRGGAGDDYLFFDAQDTVFGEGGTDRGVVLGANGVTMMITDIEWLWGSNAADTFDARSQTVSMTIFGMGGNDTLTGGSAADQLYGQAGADVIVGGDGDDWLYVDSDDVAGGSIQGGSGADRVASLDGSPLSLDLAVSSIEWVWASNFGDNLDGTTQASGLYLFAFDGGDVLRGGSGNDSLYGMAGADAMYGGGGNDVLYFDSDDTMVDGSTGYDTAQVLDYTGVGVTLDLGARQIEAVYASNQADTLDASVATWAVFMNGYNGDDVMSGGSGDDNIYGGGGADTISGGGGNDFLDGSGGPEIDTLVVSGAQADYVLHYTGGVLTSVQDLVGGRDGWDNVAGFERIQFTDGMLTT